MPSNLFFLDGSQEMFFKRQFFFSKEDIYFGYMRRHPYNFLILNVKFSIEVEKSISRSNCGKTKHYVSYEELKEAFTDCDMLFEDDN